MNNYEWLLRMGGDERQAWFDAEHVDNEMSNVADSDAERVTEQADLSNDSREKLVDAIGATDAIEWSQEQLENANPALVNALKSVDSREKLRIEIGTFIAEYLPREESPAIFKIIDGWLDRQAAISVRETAEWWSSFSAEQIDALNRSNERIAELQAKVDEYEARINSLVGENGDLEWRVMHYESEANALERENAKLRERKCPGYDPDEHRCNYHAQDFELNDSTVSRLKRENAKLSSDELHWRNQAQAFKAECDHLRGMLLAIAVIATDETDGGLA